MVVNSSFAEKKFIYTTTTTLCKPNINVWHLGDVCMALAKDCQQKSRKIISCCIQGNKNKKTKKKQKKKRTGKKLNMVIFGIQQHERCKKKIKTYDCF